MAHHYIVEGLPEPNPGDVFVITGDEARHAVTVSRLRAGERISVSDGRGLFVTAETLVADKRELSLRCVTAEHLNQRLPRIVLVQALAKGDRDERAIEAATELGVSSVIPWQASRSVSRWDGERAEKGRVRWASVVRESSKQAIRAWVPMVEPLHNTNEVALFAESSHLIVLDPSGAMGIGAALEAWSTKDIVVVVGPEGGLSPDEIERFSGVGASIVGLGSNILRTSTAGPAVLSVINELTGRW